MAIPIAVPIVAGATVLGTGVALLVRKRLKQLKAAVKPAVPIVPVAPQAPPVSNVVPPPPPIVEQTLPPVKSNPDGSPRQPGTPFVFNTNDDAAKFVAEANRLGISTHELLLRQQGVLPATSEGASPAVSGKFAIVTTRDQPPAGDLIIRSAPNGTQIGGADKDGKVAIVRDIDATWAEIFWSGGRNPSKQGFSRKAFLKLI
jgi:hypothetical protein